MSDRTLDRPLPTPGVGVGGAEWTTHNKPTDTPARTRVRRSFFCRLVCGWPSLSCSLALRWPDRAAPLTPWAPDEQVEEPRQRWGQPFCVTLRQPTAVMTRRRTEGTRELWSGGVGRALAPSRLPPVGRHKGSLSEARGGEAAKQARNRANGGHGEAGSGHFGAEQGLGRGAAGRAQMGTLGGWVLPREVYPIYGSFMFI